MEFPKLIANKKALAIITGLFFLEIFIFVYMVHDNEKNNLTGVSEDYNYSIYISEYHENVEKVIKQAEKLNSVSIFSKPDSYSDRNIKKTAAEYKKLLSVTPVYFKYKSVQEPVNYKFINITLLGAGLIIVLILTRENSEGMGSIIHASANGRGRLALKKLITLFISDYIITLVFYTGLFVAGAIIFKADFPSCLSYPIQSVPCFSECTYRINIIQFMLLFILYKAFVIFALSVIIMILMTAFDNLILIMGIIGIFGLTEYMLYIKIGYSSPNAVLKYCNFWYLISDNDFFLKYRNNRFFNSLINKNSISIIFIGSVSLIGAGVCVLMGHFMYPFRTGFARLKRVTADFVFKVRCVFEKVIGRFSIGTMELYKLLIRQKGILVIILFVLLLIRSLDYTEISKTGAQEKYYDFMERNTGPVSVSSGEEIKEVQDILDREEKLFFEMQEKFKKGEISDDEMLFYSYRYESYSQDRIFLKEIEEQTEYINDLNNKGISAWYVNKYNYNHLLSVNKDITGVIFLIALTLLSSSIFSYESENGCVDLLRSTQNGRKLLYNKKIKLAVITAIILCTVLSYIEWDWNMRVYGISGINAPASSISAFKNYKSGISIAGVLVIIFAVRNIIAAGIACMFCFASMYFPRKFTMAASFVFCMPAILYVSGFKFMKPFSITNIISFMPFAAGVRSPAPGIFITILFSGIMAAAIVIGRRKWIVNKE